MKSRHRPSTSEISALALERFGWAELHPGQLEALGSLLDGRDVLTVMPTGYGKSAVGPGDADASWLTPDAEVEHVEWGRGTVMSVEPDRATIFFTAQGYRVLSREAVEEHGLLTAFA